MKQRRTDRLRSLSRVCCNKQRTIDMHNMRAYKYNYYVDDLIDYNYEYPTNDITDIPKQRNKIINHKLNKISNDIQMIMDDLFFDILIIV